MLFITTSRRPSIRTRTFIKELERAIPGSKRIVRGKKSLDDLKEMMIRYGVSKLLVVDTKKGNPAVLRFYELSLPYLKLICSLYIRGISLQVDVKRKITVSELSIVNECGDELSSYLHNLLTQFIPEQSLVIHERKGIKAYLCIECENGNYRLTFKNLFKKVIYPSIKISKIEFLK